MELQSKIKKLQENIETVVIGKTQVVKLAITTLLAKGHLLIEDVPGIGKTTLAHALARSIQCTFHRIQFTSDLLPSDIIGVSIYDQRKGAFEFKKGPIFANVILADEINRTTPKTQSCLLEAMSDAQVSVDDKSYPLPQPFMVVATQNPIEHHGTYPLPESQLDRFMMRIRIGYPAETDEKKILKNQRLQISVEDMKPGLTVEELLDLQRMVDSVKMDESLLDYILAIIGMTRKSKTFKLGASPRGGLILSKAAKALALVEGRNYCIPDDIKSLAVPVLAHRVLLKAEPGLQGTSEGAESALQEVLENVPVPI
jgi:MoxR-like ATPase